MNIHRLVFLALLAGYTSIAAAAALPSQGTQPATALIFYAQSRPPSDLFPSLFPIIREDLAPGTEALYDQPALLVGSDALRGVTYPNIVSVKLQGRCDAPVPGGRAPSTGPLGWVVRVSGNIQPFIYIDCDRLNQVLRPAYTGVSRSERRQLLAQAISHVLLHEWNHITTQSSAHTRRGLTKSALTVNELISTADEKNLSAAR
jgi:hypothetical protein